MSKTIQISELKEMVNHCLALNFTGTNGRKAIADLFASVLFKTGNYNGFTYLPTESDIHAGHYGKDGKIRFV